MASRFVPVSSWEELKKMYNAGLLYFNYSRCLPRSPEWEIEDRRIENVWQYWDAADASFLMKEDWAYLVEEDEST